MTRNKILLCGLALAALSVPSTASAGNASHNCESWSLSAYWGSAAFIYYDVELRHYTTATSYTVAETSGGTTILPQGGGHFTAGEGINPPTVTGNYRAWIRATIMAGLDHFPTFTEFQNHPRHLIFNATFESPTVVCEEPLQDPVVFTEPGIHAYQIPSHCTEMDVKLWGAGGGNYPDFTRNAYGGGGGFTYSTFDVVPGQYYYVWVGGGGAWVGNYARGGGASYIVDPRGFVASIAGGGGGAGSSVNARGGAGGGQDAQDGGIGSAPRSAIDGGGGGGFQGGLSYDGVRLMEFRPGDYLSSNSHGDGMFRGGYGAPITTSNPVSGSGGGGTGMAGGYVNKPGQGTFAGLGSSAAGLGDRDHGGTAGFGGGSNSGLGANGRVVIYCY